MRSKKAVFNFLTTVMLEFVTIASNLILPPLFINSYGSDAYGLSTSITQFLSYLTLLQSGVGGVVRAALYKPLADGDKVELNRIMVSTESFFRKLSGISLIYILVLVAYFSVFRNEFGFAYAASLVIIISLGSILQYYFGITYQMLLESDQKTYIYSLLQLGCTVLNIIITYIAIYNGASIQMAKMLSAIVFAIRPITIYFFVKTKYSISKRYGRDDSTISQRWDGLGQTVAYFVHTKIGIFLVTAVLDYTKVTVYSIYSLITTALTTFISSISKAVQAAFGNMLAKNETKAMKNTFNAFSTLIHCITTVFFSTALVMILPFIRVYTVTFEDGGSYIQPMFAVMLVMAECIYCYRIPYHTIVISAGHYRQTRAGAYIEAGINIVISVIAVYLLGLGGVAMGTLAAMIYRTVDYVLYLRKNIINIRFSLFIIHMAVNVVTFIVAIPMCIYVNTIEIPGYIQWGVTAVIVFAVLFLLTMAMNYIFFKSDVKHIAAMIQRILTKNK